MNLLFSQITVPLEENWTDIRSEFLGLSPSELTAWHEPIYNFGWEVFGLYFQGKRLDDGCQRCPKTAAVVSQIPGMVTAGFSILAPGTHITAHVGYTGDVLRCHLGLITPSGCRLRVGGTTRAWREGKAFVFDDTIEHEAWNESQQSRVVLLLDFRKDLFEGLSEEIDARTNAGPS